MKCMFWMPSLKWGSPTMSYIELSTPGLQTHSTKSMTSAFEWAKRIAPQRHRNVAGSSYSVFVRYDGGLLTAPGCTRPLIRHTLTYFVNNHSLDGFVHTRLRPLLVTLIAVGTVGIVDLNMVVLKFSVWNFFPQWNAVQHRERLTSTRGKNRVTTIHHVQSTMSIRSRLCMHTSDYLFMWHSCVCTPAYELHSSVFRQFIEDRQTYVPSNTIT